MNSMTFQIPSFKEMIDIHYKTTFLSTEDKFIIEKSTIGSASNENWKRYRQYRITASNFYTATVNRVEPSSKVKAMYYKSLSSSSNGYGQKFEGHVRVLYEKMIRDCGISVKVCEVSFKLSQSCTYLGASLDGIVFSCYKTWSREIKCP